MGQAIPEASDSSMTTTSRETEQASFAENYASMSDAELLQLESEREWLMESAIVALDHEIAERRLKERKAREDEELPDAGPAERPYRWGKFIGGMTVLSGLGGVIGYSIKTDVTGIIVSILYGVYGMGLYEKKKWAVFFLEVGSGVGLLLVILLLIRDQNLDTAGKLAIVLAFWIPQTIYFWKRRDELR